MIAYPVYEQRILPDGRQAEVIPMTYGKARLCVGPADDAVYDDGWCYVSPTAAVLALRIWTGAGEPVGWMRHPTSGRRRPGGDPTVEYVEP